ncbi:MAG: threonine/serine exporter ThrE family protein [Lachnospiraceae bacterium]
MKTEYLLDRILKIAYDMLVSGSEVGRVEQQIERMCQAYEMEEVEVFIITSSIIVSVKDREGRFFTQTRRIRKYRTDFYRIELLEHLVSYIEQCVPEIHEIDDRRKEVEELRKKEHRWKNVFLDYLVFCLVSMIFTLFFDGDFTDGIVSFICGFFIKLSMNFLEGVVTNRFIMNLAVSVAGAFIAWFFIKVGFPISIDKVNIGNIMLLIPGLATVNAFKDLINGETITGLLRLADALVQAVAVAFGFALVILSLGV